MTCNTLFTSNQSFILFYFLYIKESPERYYPGVNSLKKVKVSPPKAGSLYPELAYETDTMSSRPDSVMSSDTMNTSDESIMTTNSEAPSLGKDIVAASRKSVGSFQTCDNF